MSKLITKWVSNDGVEWRSATDADERDVLIDTVATIMTPLGPKCNAPGFGNGHGYIQHNKDDVRDILESLEKLLPEKHHGKSVAWLLRFHFDGSDSPVAGAYNRLYCIGEDGREWGQVYFRMNPHKGDQVEIQHGVSTP